MANRVQFGVDFNVNKNSLNELVASLRKIQQEQLKGINAGSLSQELNKAGDEAYRLEKILTRAYNSKLGQFDLSKLRTEIQGTYKTVGDLKTRLESVGMGQQFNMLQSNVLKTNLQLKQSNKLLDDMAQSMSNTVKWGITSSLFNNMTNSIQKAFNYTKQLDTSLNDIRIVTDKSAESMENFAKQANSVAKNLGRSTKDFTEASLIYYQQGLGDEEVAARAETTLKAANVTGQSGQAVSEQLTAVWNGYKVTAEEAELYVDKLAAVAASTASDLEELSTGMSKVASAANLMGVDVDQLNAQLATIVSVTRQAPESVGTALKTIYARMGDIESGIDTETTLGAYTEEMAAMGVNVLDMNGNLRDMGEVIEEIGGKWSTMSREQQISLSQTMAGTRQYNNLLSLFDNWDMYTEAMETSANAAGTLQQQQDIYMESTAAHLEQLSTEAEKTYDILFDTNAVNSMTDAMTGLLNVFNNFLSGMGGGLSSIAGLAGIAGNVFSKQIGSGINDMINNATKESQNQKMLTEYKEWSLTPTADISNESEKAIYEERRLAAIELSELTNTISSEEFNKLITMQEEAKEAKLLALTIEEMIDNTSSKTFEEITAELNEQKKVLKDVERSYQKISSYTEEQLQDNEKYLEITNEIGKLEDQGLLSKEQSEEYSKINDEALKGINQEENLNKAKEIGLDILKKQSQQEVELIRQRKARQAIDEHQDISIMEDANRKSQEAKDELANKKRQAIIQQTVEGLTTVMTTLTMVRGVWMTITDPDLTGWEKFTQILPTVATGAFMVFKNWDAIKNLLPNLNAGIKAATLGNEALGTSGLFAAMGINTAKMSMWEVYLIIAAIIAIIAVVCVSIKAMSDAYNSDAIEAKKAAEAAKEVADSNQQVQDSLKNLKDKFDAYDTAVDKLKNCVEGTEEWKTALEEVNQAATEAIEAIPSGTDAETIRGLYSRDQETGQIVLDQDKMDEIMKSSEFDAQASQFAANASQFNAAMASTSSTMIDTTRDMSKNAINATDLIGTALTPMTGIFSNWALNEAEAQVIQNQLMDHLEEFSESMTNDEFRDKMKALGMDLSSLSENELTEYKDKIIKLSNSTAAASEKLRLLAGQQVDKVLGNKYEGAVKDVATKELTSRQQELAKGYEALFISNTGDYIKELDRTSTGIAKSSGSKNEIYQDALSRLQKAGYDYTAGKNGVRGTDKNREFAFYDENGEEIVRSAKWVAETIAAYEALEEVGTTAENAQKAFEGLEKELGENISTGIKDFVQTGNLESLTQEDYEKLAGLDKKELMKAMDITNSEEFDKMFGRYGYDKFNKAIDNYGTALNKFTKDMISSAKESFENIDDTEGLSLKGKKSIATAVEDALVYGGEESMKSVSDMFNKMDTDDLQEFTDLTGKITDWGEVDLSSFKNNLKEAGISTKFTDEELEKYIDTMREATNATKDFNSLSKQYAEIHDIIDGLKIGDTISAEDYAKLGDGASEYFTKMLDGTYKLTEDASKFYEEIQDKQIKDFTESLDKQRGQLEKTKELSNVKYDQSALNELSKSQYNNGFFGLFGSSVDTNDLETQLKFIEALSDNQKEVARLRDKQQNNKLEKEDYNKIAEEVKNCTDAYKNLDETIKNTNQSVLENEIALLSSAKDLDQLKEIAKTSDIKEDSLAYQQAELNLHKAEKWEDLDTEEIDDYAKHLREVADESNELADSLTNDKDTSRELSRQIVRMNQGIDDLANGWEDWSDVLKKSSVSSEEYAEALSNTKEALADILDTSVDYISKDFVKEHMEEIGKAAKGDADAIDNLHKALAKQIVLDIAIDKGLDTETQNTLLDQINTIQTQLPDLKVGASIDKTQLDQDYADFENTLANLIEQSGMTADQVNAFLGQMGYEADFETEKQIIDQQVPVTVSETKMTGAFPPSFTTRTYQDGFETVSQTVEVPKITSTVNGKKSVGIKSLSKKAGGSMNNYSSSNKGGKSPGSGSGSKDKGPDFMDYIDDEKDRYHDIDIVLKQIQNDMDKLDKQKEKLFGAKLIENLNKQLKLLDKQIDATNQKIGIAKGEMSELQGKLGSKGVAFNADGTIANYASAYQAQLGYVNSIINAYNSMSAEAQEGYKDTVEKAKEDFEKFKDNIDRYDELITDTIPGLEADIQEAIDQKIDIQIEEFDMEIEIRLNLAEAERDWNEFKRKVIDDIADDDILGNTMAKLADFSSYYKDDDTGIIQSLQRQVDDTLAQLYQMDNKGWSDVYGDNRTRALEDLKNYYDELVSNMENLEDLQDEIHEAYIDMMDEAQEKFDEQIDTYSTLSDMIEHDMNLITLIKGDEAYGQLAEYYKKQEENYNKQLDFQRQQMDFWRQQMDTLEEGSDEWEKAKENWLSAVDEWNSAVEEAIENLQDKYLNAINEIFQNLNNKVTNGLGLDYVEEQWNLINDNADQYLDTINSLYEVQKLEDKYLDALDATDSIGARRQLKKIMDAELADLRERDKLTEYDIERANMKYEIALKQIALEEAQQNKSQMRLRRDSQGNYSYQFVADENEVGKAQDELNDLYNSLYNFDKNRYQENLDQLYSVWAEFQEKMAEAAQINDPTQRAERELLLQQQYGELINGIVEQNTQIRANLTESAFDDLARLYDVDVANFQNMSDEEKDILMNDLIPYWSSGAQQMADVFAGEDGFLGVCKDAFGEIVDATKDYEDSLDDLEQTAGADFDSIINGVDEVLNQTDDLLWKNDDLINSYRDELDAIGEVINQLDELIAKYSAAKNEAIAATTAAYNYWVQEQRNAAAAAAKNQSGGAGGSGAGSGANGGAGGAGAGGRSGSGDGNLAVGDTATYSGSYYYDSYGSGPSGSRYSGVAGGIVVDKINNNPYGVHIHSADGKYRDLGWIKKSQLSGYDTGGYTGDWNSGDGRLALLHKKELVLNAQDTENMLNAVNILREVTNTLGASVLSKLSAISANSSLNGNTFGETLEQNVHIDATFPNVTNSHEIEDAINNLVNVATQRIHR